MAPEAIPAAAATAAEATSSMPAGAAAAAPSCSNSNAADAERIQWAADMRRRFSPPGMLAPDGSINQEFFRPKQVLTLTEKKWGDAEREKLYDGLAKLGVGKWREIGEALLPEWDDHAIRVKASRLLGCQNLARYVGCVLSKEQCEAEFEANKALGLETGCWKSGLLVDDSAGTLRAYFAAQKQQQQEQQQQQQAADVMMRDQ